MPVAEFCSTFLTIRCVICRICLLADDLRNLLSCGLIAIRYTEIRWGTLRYSNEPSRQSNRSSS